MAKTVDELVLKASVEGTDKIDQLNAKLSSIDESAKKTAGAMNQIQGGVRNTAYQIQDLAVQIAGGTSAFVALGQQLPQLLSGFGIMGVVIGAVAAVAIPLLQVGLKAAGVDMRNLKEMTADLSNSVTKFLDAQRENATTLDGLAYKFGALSEEAKKFNEIQEKLTKQKSLAEQKAAVAELADSYNTLKGFIADAAKGNDILFNGKFNGGLAGDLQRLNQWWKGITPEQATELSKRLKDIDKSSPKETIATLNGITEYLGKSNDGSERFLRTWEKTIAPIMAVNEQLLKAQENVKATEEAASAFNTKLANIQSSFVGRIGDARRAFDPIYALQLEKEEKIAEVRAQFAEKNKDGVNRSAEQAAVENKIRAEINDKVKDFTKSQQETFYAQQLSNEATERSLIAQKQINGLKLGQLDSLKYESVLEESRVNNSLTQVNALMNIEELLRKNLITEERAVKLRQQAGDIRKLNDDIAIQNVNKIAAENERSVRIQVEGLALENAAKAKIFELEKSTFGLSTIQQQGAKQLLDIDIARARAVADLNNNSRLSDQEKLDALIRINEEYTKAKDLVKEQTKYNEDLSKDFGKGAEDRIKGLTESFSNFKIAGMEVDAVWNNMSSALDNFVETGKLNFSDLASSIIKDLLKIELKAAAMDLFKSVSGAAGGTSGIMSLFGFADGGDPPVGKPSIVGERGPELFIPKTPGTIIPNGALGGGGSVINNYHYNNSVTAMDAKSVAQLFYDNRHTMFGTVEAAKKEMPMRR